MVLQFGRCDRRLLFIFFLPPLYGEQHQHTNLIEKTNKMKGTDEEYGKSGLRSNGNLEKGA